MEALELDPIFLAVGVISRITGGDLVLVFHGINSIPTTGNVHKIAALDPSTGTRWSSHALNVSNRELPRVCHYRDHNLTVSVRWW